MVVCGPGGVLVELLDDAALSLVLSTHEEAENLISTPRGCRVVAGFRGAPVLLPPLCISG